MAKSMRPWWMLGSVLTAGVVLAACGSSGGDDADGDGAAQSQGQQEGAAAESAELIAQGLEGEEVVECVGGDPTAQTTVQIGGPDRIHFETATEDVTASVLLDDDRVYQWSKDGDSGLVMEGTLAQQISQGMAGQVSDQAAMFESCAVYDGSDEVFDAPDSVEFTTVRTQAEVQALFVQQYKDGDGEQMLREQSLGDPAQRAEILMSIAPLLSLDDAELAEFAALDDEELTEYLTTMGGADPAEQMASFEASLDELEPEHRAELEAYMASMQGMGGMEGLEGLEGLDGLDGQGGGQTPGN